MHHEYRQANSVQQEIQALRRLGTGAKYRLHHCYGDSQLFEITLIGDHLEAAVDIYSAIFPEARTPAFDVDKWEELKVRLQAPCTRSWFKLLSRACRALLAKRLLEASEPAVMSMSLIEAARIRRDESAARRAVQRIQRNGRHQTHPLADSPVGKESEERDREAGLGSSESAQGSRK